MGCYLCGKPESVIIVNTILAFRLYLCKEHSGPESRNEQLKQLRASQYKSRCKAVKKAGENPKSPGLWEDSDPDYYFDWALFHKLFKSVEAKMTLG